MKNDYQTSTVDGAAGFERVYGYVPYDDEPDYDSDCADMTDDDEPGCNCSDPGCPCGGRKYGRL
jgi:hypothetical protein